MHIYILYYYVHSSPLSLIQTSISSPPPKTFHCSIQLLCINGFICKLYICKNPTCICWCENCAVAGWIAFKYGKHTVIHVFFLNSVYRSTEINFIFFNVKTPQQIIKGAFISKNKLIKTEKWYSIKKKKN